MMCEGLTLANKVILEPSAGKGDIVDYMKARGAEVLACESNKDLQKILAAKCNLIEGDFFNLTSEKISHIHAIVMNPPFSNADKHILHAYSIAPEGCKIIALCNSATLKNKYTRSRTELSTLIESYGSWRSIGNVFNESERRTDVDTALIELIKPGAQQSSEFEGFYMDEEPQEAGSYGIMPYNFIRDLVQRYIQAVKVFDEQLESAVKIQNLVGTFARYAHDSMKEIPGFMVKEEDKQTTRNTFKKNLQKQAWQHVFSKMNMEKYATRGLKEDINKFVEQQTEIPFTMRNIYKMLEIVIGTQEQRMDKALLEVFDRVTSHTHENRLNLEGWKTNSHYLLTEKFIMPYIFEVDYGGGVGTRGSWAETIDDMVKALCYISGTNYDDLTYKSLNTFCNQIKMNWGQWHSWGFFEVRAYKKGTGHFKFQNPDLWAKFNQRIAKLKGYPLPEKKEQTAYQDRQTGRKPEKKPQAPKKGTIKPTVLFEFELKN